MVFPSVHFHEVHAVHIPEPLDMSVHRQATRCANDKDRHFHTAHLHISGSCAHHLAEVHSVMVHTAPELVT